MSAVQYTMYTCTVTLTFLPTPPNFSFLSFSFLSPPPLSLFPFPSSLQRDSYFTVHVTPQVECSYVSFETNLEQESYTSLINRVITIFKPQKCTVSLFASKVGVVGGWGRGGRCTCGGCLCVHVYLWVCVHRMLP